MANIYTYYPTEWTYDNVTRLSDYSFKFEGVGAYATTTIIGREFGVLGSDLYIRGTVSPSQENLTQGLCCRLDMYSKQEDEEYWEIEKHFIYLKGDKNGAINQKVTTIGGFFGFFDHIDIRLEVLQDSEMALDDTIELTSFVIDDPTLNGELPAIKDTLTRHEIDLNKYGLELTEILGTEEEDGRLDVAEKNVATLEAKQIVFTETLTTGGQNLLDNATYGGREAPDDGLWCADDTVCYVLARLTGFVVGDISYPVLGRSEQKGIPRPENPVYLTYINVYGHKLYGLTYDGVIVRDKITTSTSLTRNIGVIIYDGTENWTPSGVSFSGSLVGFYHDIIETKIGGAVACSIAGSTLQDNRFKNSIYSSTNTNRLVYTLDSTAVGETVDEFKAWLAFQHERGTPVVTYFELDEPQEEIIEFQEGKKALDVIGNLTIDEVLAMEW